MLEMAQSQTLRARQMYLRRDAIYRAALELTREREFDNFTMGELAERAGVSRATVFNYFPTKDGLLVAYHGEMTAALLRMVPPKAGSSARRAIADLIARFCAWAENDRPLARAVIGRIFTSQELVRQDHEDEFDLRAWLAQALERGVEGGEFSDRSPTGPVVDLIVGLLSATALTWALAGASDSLWARVDPQLDLVLDAIGRH